MVECAVLQQCCWWSVFQVSIRDPVHVVALDSFVLSQLNQLQMRLGDAAFNSLMQTVDAEVLQQLQLFLKH